MLSWQGAARPTQWMWWVLLPRLRWPVVCVVEAGCTGGGRAALAAALLHSSVHLRRSLIGAPAAPAHQPSRGKQAMALNDMGTSITQLRDFLQHSPVRGPGGAWWSLM